MIRAAIVAGGQVAASSAVRWPAFRRAITSVIAVVGIGVFGNTAPTFANHGTSIVQPEGAIGSAHWPNLTCDVRNGRLVLPMPDAVTASYDTTGSPDSQLVWWTPRVWWRFKDPQTGNESLNHSDWAQYGWYQAWARTGDNHGVEYMPFPEIGSTGGGAFPAWSDINGYSLPFDFAVVVAVETVNSKVFWAEYIFWWAPNLHQPQDGWSAGLSNFWSDLLTPMDRCTFP